MCILARQVSRRRTRLLRGKQDTAFLTLYDMVSQYAKEIQGSPPVSCNFIPPFNIQSWKQQPCIDGVADAAAGADGIKIWLTLVVQQTFNFLHATDLIIVPRAAVLPVVL